MSEQKWYATRDELAGVDAEEVWTIGQKKNETNWETDSGCDGYGMTREAAERAVARYNALAGIEDPAAALESALQLASMCKDYLGSSAISLKGQEVFKLLGGV